MSKWNHHQQATYFCTITVRISFDMFPLESKLSVYWFLNRFSGLLSWRVIFSYTIYWFSSVFWRHYWQATYFCTITVSFHLICFHSNQKCLCIGSDMYFHFDLWFLPWSIMLWHASYTYFKVKTVTIVN